MRSPSERTINPRLALKSLALSTLDRNLKQLVRANLWICSDPPILYIDRKRPYSTLEVQTDTNTNREGRPSR
jgi:hypothetical protein